MLLLAGLLVTTEADLFSIDGVWVERHGEVRTVSGLWRVLITLQPPRRPDTQAWAGPLRASLRRAQAHTTVEDREIWEYRLANLDARRDLPVDVPQAPATVAAPTGHGGRVKRGLLNFVGELSRVLFGTATSDEVHALQESIKRLQDGMTVLHHNTRVMVSIMNQTRRYVRENRLDLRAVQAETMRLDQLARVTARRVHALELYQSRAQIRRQIDLAIQQMEMAIADYRLQRRIFHRQRLQMERGWLTEDILPRAALRQILAKIQASPGGVLRPEWYYQHIPVNPLWGVGNALIFQAAIPVLTPHQYLRYTFRYLPVPLGNRHWRQVVGRDDLAINAMTGFGFTPRDCIEGSPTVCNPGIETTGPTCEAALVMGQTADACQVTVTKRGLLTSEVYRPPRRAFILLSAYAPTELTLHCRGKMARRWTTSGPSKIAVPPECVVSSPTWRVTGTREEHRTLCLEPPRPIELPQLKLNWTTMVPAAIDENLRFRDRIEVPLAELDALRDPPMETKGRRPWTYAGSIGGGTMAASVAIAALLIAVIYKLRARKQPPTPRQDLPGDKQTTAAAEGTTGAPLLPDLTEHCRKPLPVSL